jgi:hypothetical protein
MNRHPVLSGPLGIGRARVLAAFEQRLQAEADAQR